MIVIDSHKDLTTNLKEYLDQKPITDPGILFNR